MPRNPLKLPSVEAQTVAFIDSCRRGSAIDRASLFFRGFDVYLRYDLQRALGPGRTVSNLLTIAKVEIPQSLQHRGWFWRYVQLCAALNDGRVFIECVVNLELHAALSRHPMFEVVFGDCFLLRQDDGQGGLPTWMQVWPGEPKDHRSMPLVLRKAPARRPG